MHNHKNDHLQNLRLLEFSFLNEAALNEVEHGYLSTARFFSSSVF